MRAMTPALPRCTRPLHCVPHVSYSSGSLAAANAGPHLRSVPSVVSSSEAQGPEQGSEADAYKSRAPRPTTAIQLPPLPERPRTEVPSGPPVLHSSAFLQQTWARDSRDGSASPEPPSVITTLLPPPPSVAQHPQPDALAAPQGQQPAPGTLLLQQAPGSSQPTTAVQPLSATTTTTTTSTGTLRVSRGGTGIESHHRISRGAQAGGNAIDWALRKADASLDELESNPGPVVRAMYDMSRGPVGTATSSAVQAAAKLTLQATVQAAKAAAPLGKWALVEGGKAAAGLIKVAVVQGVRASLAAQDLQSKHAKQQKQKQQGDKQQQDSSKRK